MTGAILGGIRLEETSCGGLRFLYEEWTIYYYSYQLCLIIHVA